MPKTYTVRLSSIDKLSGNNNNATYAINLSNLLPPDVQYWKVQMYFTCNTSYYLDAIDSTFGTVTRDFGKAYVLMNCSTKPLSLDNKTNGANSYLGMIRRISTTQNINDAIPAVKGIATSYYYADAMINPPTTIKRPADGLLQFTILSSQTNTVLTDTDNAGLAVADMTNYVMILSFTDAEAM